MPDKVYVGKHVKSLKIGQEYEPISRVTMWCDDEHYYTAGDDTGRELTAHCRSATQKMADNVLKQVKGYVYRPYEAEGAVLDPAAELGDGVTIGGIYSVLAHITQHFDAMGSADIGAPGEKEIDHEYPYQSPQERELKRRVKLGQSYFGTKITRREGLTIEKLVGDAIAAKVILNAEKLAFYGPNNEEQLYFDPAEGCYKFRGALNVNDKFVVDKEGNVKLAGNINLSSGSIYWGDNPPNKKRYAASTSGPWHDSMQSGDLYCCDWDYTNDKWGEPYKFVGTDGRPGSNANVPGYIKNTYIDMTGVTAPYILANLMKIQTPDDPSAESGLLLSGYYQHKPYDWLKIVYQENISPMIEIFSPKSGVHIWLGNDGNTLHLEGLISLDGKIINWGNNHPTFG